MAFIELFLHRVVDEIRLPAEQIHAEPVQHVDVFIAVEVPHARPFRLVDDDLVADFLGLRPESVHHARIGKMRTMRFRVGLRRFGARDVAAHE